LPRVTFPGGAAVIVMMEQSKASRNLGLLTTISARVEGRGGGDLAWDTPVQRPA
jgi:hypothetical protein